MVLIYCDKDSVRLRYVLQVIFEEVLGVAYQFYTDIAPFESSVGYKINYSLSPTKAELSLKPESLLFEEDIKEFPLVLGRWGALPTLFPQKNKVLPLDIFAATFYLVSRYEEYLPNQSDEHGRFRAEDALAFQHGFLQMPVVNHWCLALKKEIQAHSSNINFTPKDFSFLPTFDIDNAWAYRNKRFFRSIGAGLRDLIRGNFSSRLRFLKSGIDPYDSYQYQLDVLQKNELSAVYFFLLADYGKYDTNVAHDNSQLRALIQQIANQAKVGIHPSYASNQSYQKLQLEIQRLAEIIGKKVTHSRQHFLKLSLPDTYQKLITAGIQHDYSMGFASQAGFRASICTPFNFFDLSQNTESSLRIHPLTYMDGTLKDYMKLSVVESKALINKLVSEVKSVDGQFVALWHNHTVSDQGDWKGWREVFEENIKLCNSCKK